MIKNFKAFMSVVFALVLTVCCTAGASAESLQKLCDDASLFTSEEQEYISSQLEELTDTTGWDTVIYTNYNDVESDEMEDYCNDYYDTQGYGCGENNSGVFLTVDMSSREMYIITKGDAMYYFSDERVDKILDEVQYNLTNGNYYAASQAFITYTSNYYAEGKPESGSFSNVKLAEKSENPLWYFVKNYGIIILLIAMGISAIVAVSVKISYKNNGKKSTYNLQENSCVNLTESEDIFLNKHVSVTTVSDSHSGGHSGGGGGGGSSHGGGGRSF